MKRAVFLVLAVACGSSEKPARTEVAIAPPSASTAPSTSASSASVAMNVEPPPNNNESDEALVIEMHPKPLRQGTPVVHMSDGDQTELAGQRMWVRRVIRQNIDPIRACYAKGLATKPDLAGRVVVHFRIEPSGTVSQPASTGRTTLPSPEVVACVVDAFKPLVFPEPRGGALVVDYPMVFTP